MRPADRCAVTGKAAFLDRDAARKHLRASSMDNRHVSVYRCVAGDHWHIGHQPDRVASGLSRRMGPDEQASRLGITDSVVRRCPSCGAEGTIRIGILHAVSCGWRTGDERLPVRR